MKIVSCAFGVVTVLAFSSVVLSGNAAPGANSANAEQTVTFNRDIAPLVYGYCSGCHRPGEAGPFPLLTYGDVKKHANQIVAVTHTRFMPPWLPDAGDPKFADERRLSDAQIALIQKWVEQGAVEGKAVDLPPKPKFVEGWQLGKPDLVVTAEKPFLLPAQGSDTYWNFVLRVPIDRTRWVRAVEIRPGDKRLVHHANVLIDHSGSARRREAEPGAGFGGMELEIESERFDPDSHFLFWKPGTVIAPEPDGMALRLDPGTDLVLNVHLQPSGKPETIQPSIGIYFTDQPATVFPMLLQIEADKQLDIPAGAKDFLVKDSFTLPVEVKLMAIYPHAHYLGKDILASALLPDGSTKSLIHIKRWDLNWQAVYRYQEPILLPKGTVISMQYTYDNSERNVANPNHPPQRVVGGNRSTDEMAHLWLQVLPVNYPQGQGDPRMMLQEALALHHVEKNPADFESYFNLGAVAQARGDLSAARERYQKALEIRPDDPVASNSLGGVLLAQGNASQSVPYFITALKTRAEYFDAHYNLGIALASLNDFTDAAEQFRQAVKINATDASAQANLGSALAELGQWAEAKSCFERALQLNPQNELARDNLQEVERMMKNQ